MWRQAVAKLSLCNVEQQQPEEHKWGQWWLLIAGITIAVLCAVFVLILLCRPVREITIRVDSQEFHLSSHHAITVEQALQEAGISIGPLDRVSPPPASLLPPTSVITIVRVCQTDITRRVTVPYSRLVTEDPRQPRGYRQVIRPGKPGLKEVREQIITEDGLEVERQVLSETTIEEPTPEHIAMGTKIDPPLDAFREAALAYLGRGGITRLSPAVVEQTMFELARLRGDRYGSVRVLTRNGRPWLVLQTFARTPDQSALLVFWWTDELHAFAQVLGEFLYLVDARATTSDTAIELGLIVASEQEVTAQSPQYLLYKLTDPETNDTWQLVWSSQGLAAWRSAQGTVSFGGDGLEQLEVRGGSLSPDESTRALVECQSCPHRRFESIWQRQGDTYVLLTQRVVPSPYVTLWSFVKALHSGNITETLTLVADKNIITNALRLGLGNPDLTWTVTGRETDVVFDLRSKGVSIRVTLEPRNDIWIVSSVGPVSAQGSILFTGTRPNERGLFVTTTSATALPQYISEGQRYVWSPDYTRLAYDWQGKIYIANADGSGVRLLGSGLAPAWSPDGRRLAFERPTDRGPLIVVADLESGRETILVAGTRPSWAPTAANGHQYLAYAYSSQANAPPVLYLIDVDSGATSILASDGRDPIWSPDGTAVAFLTSRQDIVVVAIAPVRVTTVGNGWGYTWSPDGQSLAFLSSQPAGQPMIWQRMTAEIKPLLERSDVNGLSWSPDGTEIVLSLAGVGELWLVGSDGSNLRKLSNGRDPVWAWLPRAGR